MIEVLKTTEFNLWIGTLKDHVAKAKVLVRIQRLAMGNPGNVAPVGDGISELKINFGPGYRVYFKQTGNRIVLLLCGGDKSTQAKDIVRARRSLQNRKARQWQKSQNSMRLNISTAPR